MQRELHLSSALPALVGVLLYAGAANAQEIVEQSVEYRFQLDFHVPDAALQSMLPAGWEPNIAAAGNAKDANLRLIFIDRMMVRDAAGDPVGDGDERMVYLAIPVKQSTGDGLGQMIIAGLTDTASNVPGPFGTYQRATTAEMDRSITTENGATIVEEDWDFAAASGERMQMHIKYQRAAVRRGGNDTMFFDPGNPAEYRIFRPNQGIDIARNVSTNPPDHVMEFSYTASGGRIGELFDGSERALSWDSFPLYDLTVLEP
jgi:hypothetical protein